MESFYRPEDLNWHRTLSSESSKKSGEIHDNEKAIIEEEEIVEVNLSIDYYFYYLKTSNFFLNGYL